MSERPTPVPSGAILRLCAETIRAALDDVDAPLDDDDAPVLGMGAEEARVLALAASAEMERLREQVIEARADADRRVAEERALVVDWLHDEASRSCHSDEACDVVRDLAKRLLNLDHRRDRGTP